MKKWKKAAALLLTGVMCMATTACGKGGQEALPPADNGYDPPTVETYLNPIEIEGQWGESGATGPGGQYGIGDPFILRHDGKYYLYPSTSDPERGVKVFVSDDLVRWTDAGFAVPPSDETSHGAYAPEVIYHDGTFYLCQSKGGSGHYFYASDSPTGPFTRITDNLAKGIDGSFYLADDGTLYFLHTGNQTLSYAKVNDLGASDLGPSRRIENATLNHWIEGPGVFSRGDYTYLTYTGNHVISKGYRVAYSYQKGFDGFDKFIQPAQNVNFISTTDSYYGLGHSSNAVGPDLDSLYTAYHSLVGPGPARRYNLGNYFTSGGLLLSNGVPDYAAAVPARPAFEARGAEGLTASDGYLMTETSADVYTAELNFTGSGKLALSYRGPRAACYLTFGDGQIRLTRVAGDKETTLASADATLYDALNVVRVESGFGKTVISLNGMKKLTVDEGLGAGRAGYGPGLTPGYTGLSADVFGTSDFEAFKNVPSEFPAISYLKGENRGFAFKAGAVDKGGVRQGEKESTIEVGDAYAVSMQDKYDFVKYALNVAAAGDYSLSVRASRASAGAKIRVSADGKSYDYALPDAFGGEGESAAAILGEIPLPAGVTPLKVELISGKFQPLSFSLRPVGEKAFSADKFRAERGDFSVDEDSVTSPAEGTAYGDFGRTGRGNYSFTADVTVVSYGLGAAGGIAFLANDYSYYPAQPVYSFRGYLLAFKEGFVTLSLCDYGQTTILNQLARDESGEGLFSAGKTNRVTVGVSDGTITVTCNGKPLLTAYDDVFLTGSVGLFTSDLSINLKLIG